MYALVCPPLKVAQAAGGAAVALVAYAFTFDWKVSKSILRTSAGGDYVVRRSHLEGYEAFSPRG